MNLPDLPERDTSLPGSDLPRTVKPLSFFWWLNPWKHMESLFDAYTDHAEVANRWRELYHLQEKSWIKDSAERDYTTETLRRQVHDLQDMLDDAKLTLKTLKKKRRTK